MNHPYQEITKVEVDCIGGFLSLEQDDSQGLDKRFEWLAVEKPFLKKLNDLTNAGKHSVLNSLQTLRLGTEEPVFVLTSLPYGVQEKSKDCWMTAREFADGMSRVYKLYFDFFNEQSHTS